jgi:hypothetical protein
MIFKRKLNKKGEDMMVDFWAIIVFAVIVLLFFILFYASKTDAGKNTAALFDDKDAGFMLQSFLKAPAVGVDGIGPGRTVSDIIVESAANEKFDDVKNLYGQFYKGIDTQNGVQGLSKRRMYIHRGDKLMAGFEIDMQTGQVRDGVTYSADAANPGEYTAIEYIPYIDGTLIKVTETTTVTDTINTK